MIFFSYWICFFHCILYDHSLYYLYINSRGIHLNWISQNWYYVVLPEFFCGVAVFGIFKIMVLKRNRNQTKGEKKNDNKFAYSFEWSLSAHFSSANLFEAVGTCVLLSVSTTLSEIKVIKANWNASSSMYMFRMLQLQQNEWTG